MDRHCMQGEYVWSVCTYAHMNTLQSMSIGVSPWVIFSQFLLLGEQLEAVVDVNGLSALLHCFPHALVINTLLTMETCTGEVGKTHMGSNEHLLKYRIVSIFHKDHNFCIFCS